MPDAWLQGHGEAICPERPLDVLVPELSEVSFCLSPSAGGDQLPVHFLTQMMRNTAAFVSFRPDAGDT